MTQSDKSDTVTPVERFRQFTGWELQILARAVSNQPTQHPEQLAARDKLMEEIHGEFERREDLGFVDPEITRS